MHLFQDVFEFHRKFDLDRFGQTELSAEYGRPAVVAPHLLDEATQRFRENFMFEELDEFVAACHDGDVAKAVDALTDLVWVALGTAHMMHAPFDAVWAEVKRANMAKERATGADDPRSVRKSALDVVKPAGWRPPDVERVLRDYGWTP